jgi:hypothetical protein
LRKGFRDHMTRAKAAEPTERQQMLQGSASGGVIFGV